MIPLHEPRFDETDEALVIETLRSSWVSTGGPYVDKFEQEFAHYTGAKYAVSVANGTIALQLMLETLARIQHIEKPFDVLIPTLTFIATANAVVHAGGCPVFVDTKQGCFNVDPQSYSTMVRAHYEFVPSRHQWKSKQTGRPLLAIMPAHIMGWGCDAAALRQVSDDLSLPVLEDAAEALGSLYSNGKHIGRAGLAAAFSFNGNKILTTGGGGMIVTDDKDFATRAKHLSTAAKSDTLRFEHDEVGYNFRLVNILAALGCSQLMKLPEKLRQKQNLFESYKEAFIGSVHVKVYEEKTGRPNHWLVNLVFSTKAQREKALKELMKNSVGARPLWTPVHRQKAFESILQPENVFPNADEMWDRTLSVPSSPHLRPEELSHIVELIKKSI